MPPRVWYLLTLLTFLPCFNGVACLCPLSEGGELTTETGQRDSLLQYLAVWGGVNCSGAAPAGDNEMGTGLTGAAGSGTSAAGVGVGCTFLNLLVYTSGHPPILTLTFA
jgi:hypothetical protein